MAQNQFSYEDVLKAEKMPSTTGLSYEDLASGQTPEKPAEAGFIPTVKRTAGQMMTTAATSADDVVGPNAVTKSLRETGQGIIDRNPAGITSLSDVVDKPWLTVKESLGQFAPQIAAAAAGGAAGAAIGSVVPGVGTAIGGAVGSLLPIFTQEYGGIRQDQIASGQEDKGRALMAAIPATALERVGMGKALKVLKGVPIGAGSIAKEVGKGVLKEGATEGAQNVIEQVGAFKDPTTSENLGDTGLAAVMGGIGGGIMGGAGGAVDHLRNKSTETRDTAPGQEAPPAAPLSIGNTPDPLISFRDGSVARQSEVDTYLNSLPEEQRVAARAKLMGLAAQPVDIGTSPGANAPQTLPAAPPDALQTQGQPAPVEPPTDAERTAQLEEKLAFVQQQAQANGWDQRLIGARDEATAELDALRIKPVDIGALDIQLSSTEAPSAGEYYAPGDTTNPLTGERIPDQRTPSQRMGIDPAAGPNSKAAALALDSGASDQMQAQALAEKASIATKSGASNQGQANERPSNQPSAGLLPLGSPAGNDAGRGVGVAGAVPRDAGRRDAGASLSSLARNGELGAAPTGQRGNGNAPLTPSNFSGTPSATMGATGPTAQQGPSFGTKDAFAAIRASKQAVQPQGATSEPKTDQAQQSIAQPTQARGAATAGPAAAATAGQPATVGGSGVQADGLNDGAPTQNTGAQAAPSPSAQGTPTADRHPNWRKNAIQAGRVARELGLEPKGKRLAQIVAEVDARDAQASSAEKKPNALEYLASIKKARQDATVAAKQAPREIVVPAEDKPIGKNEAGNLLYERKDGSVYQMRNGRPDFGGILEPVAEPTPESKPDASPIKTRAIEVAKREYEKEKNRNLKELRATESAYDILLEDTAEKIDAMAARANGESIADIKKRGEEFGSKTGGSFSLEDYTVALFKKESDAKAALKLLDGVYAESEQIAADIAKAPTEPTPTDPIAQSVQAIADAVKGLQTALAPKVEGTPANTASTNVGFSSLEKEMQSKAMPNEFDGAIGVVMPGSLGVYYATMDDALAIARKAIAAGTRPVPFQIHNATSILLGDTDRVIAAIGKPDNSVKPQPITRADVETAKKQAAEDNYLDALFGGDSESASAAQAAPSKRRIDAKKIVPALRQLADQKQAEADDWAGRVYRNNTTQIDLRGDGPSRQDSMSTNSVNESRRRRAVEALTQQANAASKLADRVENGTIDLQSRLDSISDTVDSDMRRDGGRPMIGASRADMFEGYISNNLLGDDNYGHGKGTVARMLREAYEVAEQAPPEDLAEQAPQPITRADVTAAQQQAAAIITERIDAMTAGEVNTIARRFLPTMGVRPTVSKERNKAAATDFTKVNPLAAADEFGATLPADVRRALQSDMEGRAVADGFVEEVNPFAEYDAVAKQYGYEVRPDGMIGSDGKFPGPKMAVQRGRLRVESGAGNLLGSYAATPESIGKFLEAFWYAEKKAVRGSAPAQQEAKNPARAVADGFVEQAAAESDYASTAEQVEAAQELLLPIRQGEMITDDDRQTLESLLKIPSLKGFDQPTARRLLMIAGATKAAIEKVMRTNPVSIDDLATELGKATGEAEKKKAFDRAFNAASQIAQTDPKVKDLLDIYNLEKSILDGIASERGLYGTKWAERNVSSRWTGQSQKVRSVKQRLVDAVNKAAPSGVRQSDASAAPNSAKPIEDAGEKIGGARKDTATSTGTKPRATAKEDDRPTWAKRYEISQVAGGFDMAVNGRDITGKWLISDTRSKDAYGQPKHMGRKYFDTKEEAEAALPLIAVSQKHRVTSAYTRDANGDPAYEIWRDISDRKRVKVIDKQFATRDEAMEYMAKHPTEILEANTTFGEADIPKPESTERKGVERRTGDVKGEDFMSAFGMRGVEFGNWNNQAERQEVMNEAYDGLMDLAEVLNVPPKALGLNGDLALAFGARGQGLSSARAHYEPARVVMNLTKMNGAGALAHEWFHALDHYLARQDGKVSAEWKVNKDGTRSLDVKGGGNDFSSSGFKYTNSGVREELRTAYTSLVRSLFTKAEQYVEDTAKADKFVAVSRGELEEQIAKLRADLSSQLPAYVKRNNKPASAEQLAEFDAIAAELVEGRGLATEFKTVAAAIPTRRASFRTVSTNSSLDKLSELYKAVRGRSGRNADKTGLLDSLSQYMRRYEQRLNMLRDANKETTKTKSVPTSFAMDAKSLDQGRGSDYWTTPHEMVARAFQGYVEDKIAEQDGKSPFLNYAPENSGIITPWGAKRPFPAGDERKAMNGEFDKFVGAIQTKETDKGVAMFSRAQSPAISRADSNARNVATQMMVDGLTEKWTRVPEIIVARNMQDPQIPQDVRDYDAELKSQGSDGDARGFIYKGKVYLLSDQLKGPEQIAETLFHEVLGHYGLRGVFGEGLDPILMQLGTMRRKDVVTKAREYGLFDKDALGGLDKKTASDAQIWAAMSAKDRLSAAEEVLAEMAQTQPTIGFVKRAIALIRNWLRKNVPGFNNLRLTDSDIVAGYILPARGFVTRSQETPKQSIERAMLAFSRVWHGSPHKFLQFDSSKIGTGEGAQAYGHGLYLAESQDVARTYTTSTNHVAKQDWVQLDGVPYRATQTRAEDTAHNVAADALSRFDYDKKAAMGWLENYGRDLEAKKIIKSTKKFGPTNDPATSMYQVDLPDDQIAKMLDWDKPLSEQAPEVKKSIASLGKVSNRSGQNMLEMDPYGQEIYRALGEQDTASSALRDAGIPGIRYLDGASRGNGAGTRNYVIFPGMEKILTIIDVNGEPVTGAEKTKVLGEQMDLAFSRTPGDQTQTDAFKRWFAGSKVVDADGNPLVAYHGSSRDIESFAAGADEAGQANGNRTGAWGSYFTPSAAEASIYAEIAGGDSPQNVVPVYLAIRNPYVMNRAEWGKHSQRTAKAATSAEGRADAKAVRAGIEALGHDGIVIRDRGFNDEWVAFRPEQIKSAIGNRGTFDPTSPDIRFSRTSTAGVAARMGDAIKSVTVQSVKDKASYKKADWLGLGLQTLGRRQIVDIYGKDLPQLNAYNKLAAQMEADKNEVGAEADQLAQRWGKVKDEKALAELMHDATLAQIDPDKGYVAGDNKLQHSALSARFNRLSDEAKQVYRDARAAYEDHHSKVREAIKQRIMRSELMGERRADLLKRMDDEFFKKTKGVYFPLARFGQYVVAVKGPDGKIASVNRAETMAEAQALRASLVKAFPPSSGHEVVRPTLSKEFIASRDAVGRGFMTELYGALEGVDMGAAERMELEDTLGQLYLSSLPDLSWAKHGIHRKGTPGFSQDARRAFAQNMFHGGRYLAKLRYADLMQSEITDMQKMADDWKEVEDFDQPTAQRVVDEMQKRHESLMNPKSNPLSSALTSFGFVFFLGLSPASALVNLSQTALVAYPVMASKWGFDKSAAALLRASKQAAMGKNDITGSLNAEERAAYDEAVRAGTIDVTMAHDLAGIAQGEDSGVMWKIRPVMRWASFMFHHAERFNRQVTFIAAYRLAKDAGSDAKTAFEQATDATYKGHFDYSSGNRARIMQGNTAKVLLLFKQYGQNMIYTLARSAQQAIKGETPEARREARRALTGLLVMHSLGAGTLGLPLVTTLLAAASMIGGDDDEPWDAKVALQNMLADAFGQKPAEVMMHGLSRLTPWDISGRVGLDRLILPDVQEGLEGQRLAESAMTAALGPVAGIGVNVLRGIQDMSNGQFARGLEGMMPAAVRNGAKAIRYANEGAQDKSGIVIKDEVNPAEVIGQALGFSPSSVRNASEGKSAVLDFDRELTRRRGRLLTEFANARRDGDAEAVKEAQADIAKFNEKNPGRRITVPQMMASVRARQMRIDQAKDGVYLPKNRTDARDAGRFAIEQ